MLIEYLKGYLYPTLQPRKIPRQLSAAVAAKCIRRYACMLHSCDVRTCMFPWWISWGEEITEDQKQFTKKLFENTSKIYEFTEDYLDIFLALTSSGPAIIALIIEALSDGGLSGGLPKIISEELVMEMILGTICLIKENKLNSDNLVPLSYESKEVPISC